MRRLGFYKLLAALAEQGVTPYTTEGSDMLIIEHGHLKRVQYLTSDRYRKGGIVFDWTG